jgi:hypothetical protein
MPTQPSMPFTRMEISPDTDTIIEWDFTNFEVFDLDAIGSAAVTTWDGAAPSGITVGSPAISSPLVQTRISGATNGTTYYLKCKATSTVNGYDEDLFLALWCRRPTPDPTS